MEECSQNIHEKREGEGGRRTEHQENRKGSTVAWNQLIPEGALELSCPFRVVLEPSLCSPGQPVFARSNLREVLSLGPGSSLLLRTVVG